MFFCGGIIAVNISLIPLGFFLLALAAAVEPSPGFCARCGYNLRGSTDLICAECGRSILDGRPPRWKVAVPLCFGLAALLIAVAVDVAAVAFVVRVLLADP